MRLKIHHKITLTIFILVAILLTSVYVYLSNTLKEHTYIRIKEGLYKQVALASSYLESALSVKASFENSDAIANSIGDDLKVRCTIIREDGVVLGDSELSKEEVIAIENHADRPEIRQATAEGLGSRRRYSVTLKQDLLYIAQKISLPSLQGYMRLAMPLSDIREVQAQVGRALFVAFCIAFLVAFLISFSSSMLISRPIHYISMMAQRISSGNYKGNIHVRTGDEIEDLAGSFNEMAEQIQQRIDELNSNKVRLEAILLSMFDGIMVVNDKGSILFINAKLKELFQIADDSLGKQPIEVIRNVEVQQITDSILQQKQGVVTQEIEFVAPEEKTLLVHATSVVRNGDTDGAVLVFHDITELKSLEKVRKDFVANVSHELRTPLTSIKGYGETLLDGALQDTESAKDFVTIICNEANRLTQLVNDLLELSQLESEQYQLTLKCDNIEDVVVKVIEQMSSQARAKSITLKYIIPEDIPQVKFDEPGIVQVLLNLIDNGIKYTQAGGQVSVEVVLQDGFVNIAVKDNGVGIPESDLPRIFERFYRADKTRSCELGGTGLGLSIVKHIIHAHNGMVSVESIVGTGSVFRISIPTC